MKTINNIVYPDNMTELIVVISVRPLPNHRLWLRFSDGETKTFDMTPLLQMPCYQPLRDVAIFNQVYLDLGIPTWQEGAIDVAPEMLYQQGIPC